MVILLEMKLSVSMCVSQYNQELYLIELEMFYLNTIKQLFIFVQQLDQSEVCLPYSRLLTGILIPKFKVQFK